MPVHGLNNGSQPSRHIVTSTLQHGDSVSGSTSQQGIDAAAASGRKAPSRVPEICSKLDIDESDMIKIADAMGGDSLVSSVEKFFAQQGQRGHEARRRSEITGQAPTAIRDSSSDCVIAYITALAAMGATKSDVIRLSEQWESATQSLQSLHGTTSEGAVDLLFE